MDTWSRGMFLKYLEKVGNVNVGYLTQIWQSPHSFRNIRFGPLRKIWNKSVSSPNQLSNKSLTKHRLCHVSVPLSNQEHFTSPKSNNYGNNMSSDYDNNLPVQEMTDVMPALSNTKVDRCGIFGVQENIKNKDKIFTYHLQAVNNLSQLVFWKIGQKWNTGIKEKMKWMKRN